jgi:hypothetical protein
MSDYVSELLAVRQDEMLLRGKPVLLKLIVELK